ncbi:Abi-alpha family protein [Sphingomonas sp. NCPPB 2930]
MSGGDISEGAKAVQEVAKASGKAIDTVQRAGSFLASVLQEPLETAVGVWADKLKYHRWERQLRLMDRADALLAQRGLDLPSRPLPLKLAVPLLEAATLEDDDSLQDRWASLLANAVDADSGVTIERMHIAILEQMSASDAVIFDKLFALPYLETWNKGIDTKNLPASCEVFEREGTHSEPDDATVLSLANLQRLQLITGASAWNGAVGYHRVVPQRLGLSLAAACARPAS